MTDAARFRDVSRNDVFGSGKDEVQIQKVEKTCSRNKINIM